MVNVNRHPLSSNELTLLFQEFDQIISKFDRESTTQFLDELLGKEERLILAKRLAAIVLLHEGCSEYKTAQVLKLSPTTTGIIASKLQSGTYNHVIKLLTQKKKTYSQLLDAIDSVLHLGGLLPHRQGLDRYR